ncbi:DUF3606 domain-containing protein [Novosphingobium sp. JCM 18896]|uniref:DUF3606 domain-containing protein n=1 Tax=Novosphingobium sp. JCM 18896 TaxID=2989731 RepID=UPI0022227C93|nr:DUF3606 domain-containing protein [Novosphingobium sp. JCM 18896]MCW1429352.1 DUF3606 domain-containing protein [Novosphingobium sp. JCM 18896]
MSDDKTEQGIDRRFVASGEDYEVRHFAERHDISIEQAERLIEQHGNGRTKLDEAAKALKV